MNESAREILASGAAELRIALDGLQLDTFEAFTSMLLEWNEKLNLTRITEPAEITVKHYLDSLALLRFVEVPVGAIVIDVGTGAGVPGIPLKIARPDLRVTLLDSVRKKLTFVEAVVGRLGIRGVERVHVRAEDLGRVQSYRERFDLAISRAVGRLNALAELCLPFCRVGGTFAAYKGPDALGEAVEAGRAVRILGGEAPITKEFVLPGGNLRRTLVIVRKSRETPARYPRKAGAPERNPL